MLKLTEALHDIVNNININYDELQVDHAQLSSGLLPKSNILQLKKLPFTNQIDYLSLRLLKLLRQIYFEGLSIDKSKQRNQTNIEILRDIDSQQINWKFYKQLDKNNKGSFWLHPSFHIVEQESNDGLLAEYDNSFLQISRECHLPTAFQSATIGDPIPIKIPSSFVDYKYYMAIGNSLGGFPPARSCHYTMLIHFNFNSEAAIFAMNCFTTELNEFKIMFRFKVLHNPLNYGLYSSGILQVFSHEYDPSLYQEAIMPLLQTIYTENKQHFKPEIPIFNKMLAPGIGLAERPYPGIKFRHSLDAEVSYCEFIADALLEACQKGDESPEARMRYITQTFERLGIDIERSYINPGLEDIYTPLSLSDDTQKPKTSNKYQMS